VIEKERITRKVKKTVSLINFFFFLKLNTSYK